jgi:hypothetical protein
MLALFGELSKTLDLVYLIPADRSVSPSSEQARTVNIGDDIGHCSCHCRHIAIYLTDLIGAPFCKETEFRR